MNTESDDDPSGKSGAWERNNYYLLLSLFLWYKIDITYRNESIIFSSRLEYTLRFLGGHYSFGTNFLPLELWKVFMIGELYRLIQINE